jgi:hypothetical protein
LFTWIQTDPKQNARATKPKALWCTDEAESALFARVISCLAALIIARFGVCNLLRAHILQI